MFQEGQQIGGYTLLRRLGKGGFGEVWLAEKRSQLVTKKVAVKLPLEDQVNIEAIRHEAELWEQASGHANVLPIIDADVIDGQVLIVSEYASGGSLHDKLRREGKLPVKQAIEMTTGILHGLEFLHHRKIIHRDIKPQNILLQGETPRLADFGISRAMQTTAVSSTIIGTDAYMSPESFEGKRTVQTDIWSVGVVLYQLLMGQLPFPQEHPSERMFAILTREFESLPNDVPNSLQGIVGKALAKSPGDRYRTAREMSQDLQQSLIGIAHPTLAQTEVLHIPISNNTLTDISTIDELFQNTEPNKEITSNTASPGITSPPIEAEPVVTQFKQVSLTENKSLSDDGQNFAAQIGKILLGVVVIGLIAMGAIRLVVYLLDDFGSTNLQTGTNTGKPSNLPMSIEIKMSENVPLTIKVDGKDESALASKSFTAQNSFTIEYSVYQVDKFQLKINGQVIRLSKTPPLGGYTSRFEVTKDNLNQVLQNGSNENSSVSNSASTSEMNIELNTTTKVFFIATIDGKDDTFFSEPGVTKRFNPRNFFNLSYSKIAFNAVQLKLNGQSIQLPGDDHPEETMIDFKISKNNLAEILQSGKITESVTSH
jgi:serine/threonine protein kinase